MSMSWTTMHSIIVIVVDLLYKSRIVFECSSHALKSIINVDFQCDNCHLYFVLIEAHRGYSTSILSIFGFTNYQISVFNL